MRVETITRTLYQFDELSDKAKENARDWYRNLIDSNDYDSVIDDAKAIAKLMGIEITNIYWSGFSSQGDGACFEGTYQYKKGSVKAVKEYAPKDEKLHSIVESLFNIQKRNGYGLQAKVFQFGRYYHSNCVRIEVEREKFGFSNKDENELKETLKDYMNWIYKQLDEENDYLYSAEHIDDTIRANEYEFTENGKKA
jgi:hypothetical protein